MSELPKLEWEKIPEVWPVLMKTGVGRHRFGRQEVREALNALGGRINELLALIREQAGTIDGLIADLQMRDERWREAVNRAERERDEARGEVALLEAMLDEAAKLIALEPRFYTVPTIEWVLADLKARCEKEKP